MRKTLWLGVAVAFIISSMLFTVSCAKKTVETDTAAVDTEQMTQDEEARLAAERAKQEELDRQLEEARLKSLEEERLKEEAARAAEEAARNLFINEDVYFEFDSSALLSTAQDVLKRKAEWLRANPYVSIIIEGHCDERGTNEYNLALGDRRANSAKAFLVDLGIDASRMTTISYGEERPVDPRSNEEAWAKNRRAHFVIAD
jgi:peptidoglycan-associated lipoprotein